jgi:hypothetical protein
VVGKKNDDHLFNGQRMAFGMTKIVLEQESRDCNIVDILNTNSM